jgi:hypothetical protein
LNFDVYLGHVSTEWWVKNNMGMVVPLLVNHPRIKRLEFVDLFSGIATVGY